MTTPLVALIVACSTKPGPPEVPEAPEVPEVRVPEPVEVPEADADTAPADPAALYAACEARVEQPQSPGECATDGDCVTSGCSSELCVPKSAGQMMTTCEVKPCFAVLQTCGCHDGQCTWTVGTAAPPSP